MVQKMLLTGGAAIVALAIASFTEGDGQVPSILAGVFFAAAALYIWRPALVRGLFKKKP